jgi:hypothetical protein
VKYVTDADIDALYDDDPVEVPQSIKRPPPNGKAHDDYPGDPEPWGDLVPLSDVPEAPAFPLGTLPVQLGQFVQEVAWAVNCPPDFLAVPLLTMAGGAVANAARLQIHDKHHQSACVWTYIVGSPGSAKSPALEQLQAPFVDAQVAHFARWQKEMNAWLEADKKERGPRPVLGRCLTDDTTVESLMVTLDQNGRGVLMVRDELAALVDSMDQYKGGKGNDRQVYLKLWAHAPVIRDRKSDTGRPTFIVPRPFVAITGGVQPSVLARLRHGGGRHGPAPDDGFLDRFWGSYPADLPAVGERWTGVDAGARRAWSGAVGKLLDLPMAAGKPNLLKLTRCGKRAWEKFSCDHAAEVNDPDFPDWLRGPWAKFKGGCGRFALVVYLLRWACGEAGGGESPFALNAGVVDGESVRRAAHLVDYFKGHAKKIHAAADTDPRVAVARRVLRCSRKSSRSLARTLTLPTSWSEIITRPSLAIPIGLPKPSSEITYQSFTPGQPCSRNHFVSSTTDHRSPITFAGRKPNTGKEPTVAPP